MASPTAGRCRRATSSTWMSRAYIDGVHGDTSATFAVGELDRSTEALVQTTVDATLAGIAAVAPAASCG